MSDSNSSISGEVEVHEDHKKFSYEEEDDEDSEEEQNHQYLVIFFSLQITK